MQSLSAVMSDTVPIAGQDAIISGSPSSGFSKDGDANALTLISSISSLSTVDSVATSSSEDTAYIPAASSEQDLITEVLPTETIICILNYLSPRDLLSLACVNRNFHHLLITSKTFDARWEKLAKEMLQEARLHTIIPRDVTRVQAVRMLALKTCEVCKGRGGVDAPTVRMYWSFRRRLCERCFESETISEQDLIKRYGFTVAQASRLSANLSYVSLAFRASSQASKRGDIPLHALSLQARFKVKNVQYFLKDDLIPNLRREVSSDYPVVTWADFENAIKAGKSRVGSRVGQKKTLGGMLAYYLT